MEDILISMMICLVIIIAILGRFDLKLQKMKIEQGNTGEDALDLRKQLGYILAENNRTQERLKNIEYLLSTEQNKPTQKINIEEKEEIKIEHKNDSQSSF